MLLCYVMYVMSSTRWERTVSPLGTYWSCDPMKLKK